MGDGLESIVLSDINQSQNEVGEGVGNDVLFAHRSIKSVGAHGKTEWDGGGQRGRKEVI